MLNITDGADPLSAEKMSSNIPLGTKVMASKHSWNIQIQ